MPGSRYPARTTARPALDHGEGDAPDEVPAVSRREPPQGGLEQRRGSLRGDRALERQVVERSRTDESLQRGRGDRLSRPDAAIPREHGGADRGVLVGVLVEGRAEVPEVRREDQLREVDEPDGPVPGHDDVVGAEVAVYDAEHVRGRSQIL